MQPIVAPNPDLAGNFRGEDTHIATDEPGWVKVPEFPEAESIIGSLTLSTARFGAYTVGSLAISTAFAKDRTYTLGVELTYEEAADLRDRLTALLASCDEAGYAPDEGGRMMAEHEAAFGDEHDENCPLCGVDAQITCP